MITTVVFDADETLIDLRPAVRGALTAVLDELRRLTPAAAALTLADLEADWAAAFAELAAEPVTRIRREALARSLVRVELDGELDRVAELYFARRFSLTRPFAEVDGVLAELGSAYRLGFATNGNSAADRCGLAGRFDFEVYAHADGLPKKPAAEFFAAVAAAAGVPPGQVLHVGDNLAHDVTAAQRAGMRTVWLNHSGQPLPAGVKPDAVIGALAELPATVRHICART